MLLTGARHLTPGTFLDGWQSSVGEWSEAAGPLLFGLAALASAWVFYDARRRAGFGARSVWAWALLTLLFPPAVLPLYLAARLFTRRAGAETTSSTESAEQPETEAGEELQAATFSADEGAGETRGAGEGVEVEDAADSGPGEGETSEPVESKSTVKTTAGARLAPTLLYASALLLAGGLYFYADYRSFDAHLARAGRAKLGPRPEAVIEEYRAALRVREDGHTRKLLGLELLGAGRHEEALAELRAAARAGETDETIHFHAAAALDALARRDEAAAGYRKFLDGRLCARPDPTPPCHTAARRLQALTPARAP